MTALNVLFLFLSLLYGIMGFSFRSRVDPVFSTFPPISGFGGPRTDGVVHDIDLLD